MPPTPRSTAQNEWYHLVLTIFRRQDNVGGDTITAATGVLSATGATLKLDGRIYPPVLDRSIKVARMFSTVAQSVSVSLLWDRDAGNPIDIDFRWAVGELALIDEDAGGTTTVAWNRRLRLASGRISSYRWGDNFDALEVTLAGTQMLDRGDWYAPGAELSSERFPDIASAANRDRARKSDGLLPPRVWAPSGTALYVPALVIQDEDDAVTGVSDIGYRRYLLGYERPTQVAADEQFRQRNSDQVNQWLESVTATQFRATPASALDGLGDEYWYVVGDFVGAFGSASVSFTLGSDIATFGRTRRRSREGWQVKGSTGGADDYLVVLSREENGVEIGNSAGAPVNYGGPSLVNGAGDSVPLPPDVADGTMWLPTSGGHRGLSQLMDVLGDWLRLARFDVPIAYGDLDALRSRVAAWTVSYVRRARGSPWAKILEVLEYVPIRPYLHDGVLRFRWVGAITDADLAATIDLDLQRGAYRVDPVQWADSQAYPIVEVGHQWDIPDQTFQRTIVIDDAGGGSTSALYVTCGRALRAWHEWRDVAGCRRREQAPRLHREYDTLELAPGPQLAALWLLHRYGLVPHRMTIQIDATWRWLSPGDAVRITQDGVTWDNSRWWVEGVTFDGAGRGELLLEGVRP